MKTAILPDTQNDQNVDQGLVARQHCSLHRCPIGYGLVTASFATTWGAPQGAFRTQKWFYKLLGYFKYFHFQLLQVIYFVVFPFSVTSHNQKGFNML